MADSRKLRNIFGYIVLQLDLAGLDELKDRDSGKLFGNRSDPENLCGINRHLEFQIGHAKAFSQEDGVVMDNQHSRTGRVGRKSLVQKLLQCRGVLAGRSLRPGRRYNE